MLESVEAELVQQCRHSDVRVVRHRIPQCQGAVRGQLAYESFRKRLDGVIIAIIRLLSTDGDDGALGGAS